MKKKIENVLIPAIITAGLMLLIYAAICVEYSKGENHEKHINQKP